MPFFVLELKDNIELPRHEPSSMNLTYAKLVKATDIHSARMIAARDYDEPWDRPEWWLRPKYSTCKTAAQFEHDSVVMIEGI